MPTIDDLILLLEDCPRLLVFTGAGISTDSGIPDFRGPDGIWNTVDPADFTIDRYLADPAVRRRSWASRAAAGFLGARPNPGHLAVTRLWAAGRLAGCVTQNVDGLHQAAGMPEEAVVELHGNATTTTCHECGTTWPTTVIAARLDDGEDDPPCLRCGGVLKTDVVLFGEDLPVGAFARAQEMAAGAGGVLAVGTTLGVWPAAGIPLLVAAQGGPFAIVNQGPSELDHQADLVLDAPVSRTLVGLADALR